MSFSSEKTAIVSLYPVYDPKKWQEISRHVKTTSEIKRAQWCLSRDSTLQGIGFTQSFYPKLCYDSLVICMTDVLSEVGREFDFLNLITIPHHGVIHAWLELISYQSNEECVIKDKFDDNLEIFVPNYRDIRLYLVLNSPVSPNPQVESLATSKLLLCELRGSILKR